MQNRKYIYNITMLQQKLIVDVRPINNFVQGHIVNSISFPVLSAAELAILKQNGFTSKRGKEIVSKCQKLIDKLKVKSSKLPIVIVCQNGGLASKFIWETLRTERETYVFKGGYNQYKLRIRELFLKPYYAFVLCGKTGSGKTQLLELLEKRGVQTLNLEKVACHAGSVFGNLENRPQPTQEQFENILAFELQKISEVEPLVLEYETANIGKVFVPAELLQLIKIAEPIYIKVNETNRVKRLVQAYANINDENLKAGIEILKDKMGAKNAELIVNELFNKNYKAVAKHLIAYFDNTKSYAQLPYKQYFAKVDGNSIEKAEAEIQNLLAKKKRPPKRTLL